MRHIKIIGLCLAAVVMIAAVTAGTASAKKPEWGKCVAQAGGKYLDGNCQTKGKGGSFEWKKGATLPNVPFTGHSEGSGGVLSTSLDICEPEGHRVTNKKCVEEGGTVFETGEGEFLSVECTNETNSGEAEGKNKIANVHVTFTGCQLFASPCTGPGLAEGEIRTSTLKGELGYINKEGPEVGVKLEPAEKHGHFAQFLCSALVLTTTVGVGNAKEGAAYSPENKGGNDQIISPITPINAMTSTYTQVYTGNYKSVENTPNKFEGKATSLLEDYIENPSGNSSKWSKAVEEITNVNTPSEPGEIKA